MATLDLSTIKPIPGFDCVEWKRQRQAQIFEETKHMTLEERRERTRKVLEKDGRWQEAYARADSIAANN
jgi:hypothetical protein